MKSKALHLPDAKPLHDDLTSGVTLSILSIEHCNR